MALPIYALMVTLKRQNSISYTIALSSLMLGTHVQYKSLIVRPNSPKEFLTMSLAGSTQASTRAGNAFITSLTDVYR